MPQSREAHYKVSYKMRPLRLSETSYKQSFLSKLKYFFMKWNKVCFFEKKIIEENLELIEISLIHTLNLIFFLTKKLENRNKNLFVSLLKECFNQSNKQCCIAVKKFWRIFKTAIKFNGFVFMIFRQICHQFCVFFL